MLTNKELFRQPEYWIETIQNEFFRHVDEYMNDNNMNRTQLAEKLGVSKGYVSQILNGTINCSFKKLIEIAIAIDKAPNLQLESLNAYTEREEKRRFSNLGLHTQVYQEFTPVSADEKYDCLPVTTAGSRIEENLQSDKTTEPFSTPPPNNKSIALAA